MALRLKIVTPNGIFFDKDIKMVTVKTEEGYIGFLENHSPFVATLVAGDITINNGKKEQIFRNSTGLIYVLPNSIKILTDEIKIAANKTSTSTWEKRENIHENITINNKIKGELDNE